jgi:predicted nucleotidyltransferase
MRKHSAADALFPAVRKGVLGAIYSDPRRWWYLSELAQGLGTSPSSLQREVESLAGTGILETRREGGRAYYRAHAKGAIFNELRGIVRKTMGVPAQIRDALMAYADRIALAFIYGSVAQAKDRADSDVDLMIVADHLALGKIYGRLASVERKLRRKVNVTLYTTEEFRRQQNANNPFLDKVLARERIVLFGSEDGLRAG